MIKLNKIVIFTVAATVAVTAYMTMTKQNENNDTQSPSDRAETSPTLGSQRGNSERRNLPIPPANLAKDIEDDSKNSAIKKETEIFSDNLVTADKPFEDWLLRFGFELTAADIITMLRSNMPPQRKRRLLDFFVSESDEGYAFFSSQSGAEFLEQVLSDPSTDAGFAHRIGNILRWFSRNRPEELSEQYETRFSKSSSVNEKIGLMAAISDANFLKKVAYNHREPELVRRVAIENLLLDDKEPKTLKGLLDISDTQPALSAAVISAAVRACINRDEFQNVLDTLKKEGMQTPLVASIVGKALATSRRSYWARGLDPSADAFLGDVVKAFRQALESGATPQPFP
jgi:hypothetical protein